MSVKVFAIFDTKAKYFAVPFLARNEFSAKRMFTESCSAPDTELYKYPTDYELFYIADFDEDTGVYTSVDKESLGLAASYRRLDFYPVQPVPETIDGDHENEK